VPIFYVGGRVTAERTESKRIDYPCVRCGVVPARVVGTGKGTGVSPFFLAGKRAQINAHHAALAVARREIDDILTFSTCPRCKARAPSGARRFRLQLGAAGAVATIPLLAMILFGLHWAIPAVAIGGALVFAVLTLRIWIIAPARIVPLTPEELATEKKAKVRSDARAQLRSESDEERRRRRRERSDEIRRERRAAAGVDEEEEGED